MDGRWDQGKRHAKEMGTDQIREPREARIIQCDSLFDGTMTEDEAQGFRYCGLTCWFEAGRSFGRGTGGSHTRKGMI